MNDNRAENHRLAIILAKAPMWARLALTAADDRERERAAETLAAIVLDRLGRPKAPQAAPR